MEQFLQLLGGLKGSYVDAILGLIRYAAPALAIFLLW